MFRGGTRRQRLEADVSHNFDMFTTLRDMVYRIQNTYLKDCMRTNDFLTRLENMVADIQQRLDRLECEHCFCQSICGPGYSLSRCCNCGEEIENG